MRAEHRPISPPKAKGARGHELPAYVSNGLVGLRVTENPLTGGVCIVSGFAGEHPEKRIQAAAFAPYPLAGEIILNGLSATHHAEAIRAVDQSYDFATAELISRFQVRLGEVVAAVEVITFASRTHPTVVCQEVSITPDIACDLTWRAVLDPTGVRGRMVERLAATPGEDDNACDGSVLWEAEGGLSRCGLALWSASMRQAQCERSPWDGSGPLATGWSLRARGGTAYRFRQMTSLVPSILHQAPHRQAVRLVRQAAVVGFDEIRRRNRAAWADLWRGRIQLAGAEPRWQAMADAALFYLNTSVHPSSPSSTSIYGLATWRDYTYYFGHVMWDVDAFCVPVVSLLQPPAAGAMLGFRTRTLEAAKRNAQLLGRRGAQFPWEASPLEGEEATPGGAEAAAREDHINLHVARAFAFHADVSRDERFEREQAWPVIAEVCDWLIDRVTETRNGFSIREGGGPAERPDPEDDDALTLILGRLVLEDAVARAARLGLPTRPEWSRVAAGLEPPIRSDGATAQHAGYRKDEEKGATPSPLMAIFPYWAEMEPDRMQTTLDFYLKQWPDYVGSPMLAALYGVWAAWTGDRRLSARLLDEGYAAYQYGRFQQTLEYRLDKIPGVASGPFFANMGGFLLSLLLGFTGVRPSGDDPAAWPTRPVVLPDGWRSIRCDQVWIGCSAFKLTAEQGADRATLIEA